MTVKGLFLIACAFISLTTQAADRSGSFAIKGAGLMTCQQVVSSQKAEAAMLNLYWMDIFPATTKARPTPSTSRRGNQLTFCSV